MINYDEIDMTLAIQLQAQFEEELRVQRVKEKEKQKSLEQKAHKWNAKLGDLPEPEQEKLSVSLIDPSWELLDPNPNIYDLFLTFNHQFFWGRLLGVEVKWSPRMTLCAGVCSYEGKGGLCSVRLSTPLLKLRPRKDLLETLLHEMIHAYLFITDNNKDHDGHGPQFHKHMYRINKLAGTNISVYHTFHDEVNSYRQHVWQCNGSCRNRPPYYGLVKRSMNRAPSPRDPWWSSHAQYCGGTYSKIKEPDGYGAKTSKRKGESTISGGSNKDIRSYLINGTAKKSKPANDSVKRKKNSGGLLNGSDSQSTPSNIHGFGRTSGAGANYPKPKTKTPSVNGFPSGAKGMNAAVSTSFGSKTVVVKKKTSVSEGDKTPEHREESFTSFTGNSYVLGGNELTLERGRSRLLDKFDNSKGCKVSEKRGSPHSSKRCGSEHKREQTECPLCQTEVCTDEFEDHIAVCLGDDLDHDDIEMIGEEEEETEDRSNVFRAEDDEKSDGHLDDSVVIVENEPDEGFVAQTRNGNEIRSEQRATLFPCPVCSENFVESKINNHVNAHFE